MKLIRPGTQPSAKGHADFFAGTVRIDMLNNPPLPARASCASVTFEPGARSAWHTHPLGQTLIVTAGCGWTQCEGEPIVEIRAGDVIWCPPGHKHWHGDRDDRHDAHLGGRGTRRAERRLAGARHRRRIPRGVAVKTRFHSIVICLAITQAFAADAQLAPVATSMQITRAGSQPSAAGPNAFFTGRVRVDPIWPADANINAAGANVTFEPGARSAWHTHPAGQHLVVVSGVGRTQEWGKTIQEIRPGDVVWCPPGVKHWHGASPTTAMTHLSVAGTVDGKNVNWMEKVSDEQYTAR